jgi:hypothetical protein
MNRIQSKRFKFDYEYYSADLEKDLMLHLRIYCEGAMHKDLWFDDLDQEKLLEVLKKKKR